MNYWSGDDAVHGEDAYAFGEVYGQRSLLHGDTERKPINGDGELGIIQGQNVLGENNGASTSGASKAE